MTFDALRGSATTPLLTFPPKVDHITLPFVFSQKPFLLKSLKCDFTSKLSRLSVAVPALLLVNRRDALGLVLQEHPQQINRYTKKVNVVSQSPWTHPLPDIPVHAPAELRWITLLSKATQVGKCWCTFFKFSHFFCCRCFASNRPFCGNPYVPMHDIQVLLSIPHSKANWAVCFRLLDKNLK